jgi:pyridoxamine 5'-phosphate oxidase
VEHFRRWFDQAVAAELSEPKAMVLGTTDGRRPSTRSGLLKTFDRRGFMFFTHYGIRLGAWVSQQSTSIRSRSILEAR